MNPAEPAHITALLRAWAGGDSTALERLTPLVYEELRRMARRYMHQGAKGQTLQPTALVNEAYLRLVVVDGLAWQNRPTSSRSPRTSCATSWWMGREPVTRRSGGA